MMNCYNIQSGIHHSAGLVPALGILETIMAVQLLQYWRQKIKFDGE